MVRPRVGPAAISAFHTVYQPRRLAAIIAALGVISAFAFLVIPVSAGLDDDPLLRLRSSFSPGTPPPAAEVDCGSAIGSLKDSGGVTLYGIARDAACRGAASRRIAIAVAAGSLIVLTGFLGLTVASRRGDFSLS